MITLCRLTIIGAIAAGLLSACSPLPTRSERGARSAQGGSGAIVPPPPSDAQSIPDAIPRAEPRSRFGNPSSYEVFGQRFDLLPTAAGYVERGTASWYGPGFHGERTSSGETYNMYLMTAAHKTLPIPAYAQVTNLNNGRSVVVRINDRGPFVGNRLIDLSWSAAARLDMLRGGTAPVEVRVLSPDTGPGDAGPVVKRPSDPAPVPEPVLAPDSNAGSYLQVASFSDATNAQRLILNLADAGIRNSVIREADAGSRHVWRVRVGPIANRLELDDYTQRLALLGIPDARLAHD